MTLEEVRKQIDVVDKQIKVLFKERMILADQVARVKADQRMLYISRIGKKPL